jgi:hypothetical protein
MSCSRFIQWYHSHRSNLAGLSMQVPMLTAREELDIGEKTVAAEIDAYFR